MPRPTPLPAPVTSARMPWPFIASPSGVTGVARGTLRSHSARKPAAQNGTSRSWTVSRSLALQTPPDSLSMRPVSANVSVSAPERKWYAQYRSRSSQSGNARRIASMKRCTTVSNVFVISTPPNSGELLISAISAK